MLGPRAPQPPRAGRQDGHFWEARVAGADLGADLAANAVESSGKKKKSCILQLAPSSARGWVAATAPQVSSEGLGATNCSQGRDGLSSSAVSCQEDKCCAQPVPAVSWD